MKRSWKDKMRNSWFFHQLKWVLVLIVFLMVFFGFYLLYLFDS